MKKAAGQSDFARHVLGERLSASQAFKAKCYDCTCGYADGREDCHIPSCPLYPYMPNSSQPAAKVNKGRRAQQAKTLMQVFLDSFSGNGDALPDAKEGINLSNEFKDTFNRYANLKEGEE